MLRRIVVALVTLSVILAAAGPSAADHRHGRGGVEVFIGGPPVVAAPPDRYRPGPYVVYPAPPVIYKALPPPPPLVWHYCQSYGAYYPSVPHCLEGWLLVPGR